MVPVTTNQNISEIGWKTNPWKGLVGPAHKVFSQNNFGVS
jgi:hypothetical protein